MIGEASGEYQVDVRLQTQEQTTTYRAWYNDRRCLSLYWMMMHLSCQSQLASPVTEALNATADFTISAAVSPNDYITIRYDLAESQNFIDNEGTGKLTRLDFRNDAKEATLSIPIFSDTKVETDGTITVTLVADNANPITYNVAASPNDTAVS